MPDLDKVIRPSRMDGQECPVCETRKTGPSARLALRPKVVGIAIPVEGDICMDCVPKVAGRLLDLARAAAEGRPGK